MSWKDKVEIKEGKGARAKVFVCNVNISILCFRKARRHGIKPPSFIDLDVSYLLKFL